MIEMSFTMVFALLGALTLSYLTLRFLHFIYLYSRPSSLKKYRYGREPWALVTGASGTLSHISGIIPTKILIIPRRLFDAVASR